jgi:hypothetical protein
VSRALGPRSAKTSAKNGRIRVLTYNVAGLPGFLSASRPGTNHALVSPLFNHYDLVFAQEDFAYHRELVQYTTHPYQLSPLPPASTMFGDGLCGLSVFPLRSVVRVRWKSCYGYLGHSSDCFGEKGFSASHVELSPGVIVDIYNLHAEAGDSVSDMQTRRRGFRQLTSYIKRHSGAYPVIVAGDTNLDTNQRPYDARTFGDFLSATGLSDACRELECRRPRLDRVLFRSSKKTGLEALSYGIDQRFVDAEGRGLSDHEPVYVELAWQVL